MLGFCQPLNLLFFFKDLAFIIVNSKSNVHPLLLNVSLQTVQLCKFPSLKDQSCFI